MFGEVASDRPSLDSDCLAVARDVIERHIVEGTTPGAVGLVLLREGKTLRLAVGRHNYSMESDLILGDELYDLASLTKVVVTSTLCMVLEQEGRLDLERPISDSIPEFVGNGRELVTARHLLAHCSGLPAYKCLYRWCKSKKEVLEAIYRMPLVSKPGEKTSYSDIGFLLLGELVERLGGDRLDRLAQRFVFEPIGMGETTFRPSPELRARIPPTELDVTWRRRLVHGEVHDENAMVFGGVASHAGLFSTADDLGRFLRVWLCDGKFGKCQIYPSEGIRRFIVRTEIVPGSTQALGWDTVSGDRSSSGRFFSSRSYGHLGFTGTSIWIDPDQHLGVVLLTNRIHPTRENLGIRELRSAFHDAVFEAVVH